MSFFVRAYEWLNQYNCFIFVSKQNSIHSKVFTQYKAVKTHSSTVRRLHFSHSKLSKTKEPRAKFYIIIFTALGVTFKLNFCCQTSIDLHQPAPPTYSTISILSLEMKQLDLNWCRMNTAHKTRFWIKSVTMFVFHSAFRKVSCLHFPVDSEHEFCIRITHRVNLKNIQL